MPISSVIASTGSYLPETVISNHGLEKIPPSLAALIEQKTGVKTRRFAGPSQCTSDLAIAAAENCLVRVGFDPVRLDAVILGTSSPDRIQPATATRVQHKIGAVNAFAFDLNSVCSSGVYALKVADAFIKSGYSQSILVVAAEIYSRYLDPKDFSTYPYFGDGAGAVLLTAAANTDRGLLYSLLKTDGQKADVIQIPAGGTMLPYTRLENPKDVFFKMVGREVYDFAVNEGTNIIEQIIREAKVEKEEISYIVAHQANINILKEISSRTGLPLEKFVVNLDRYGNTAAASVLIALDELLASGQVKAGELILLVAFGGGLSWGANLFRY